jgi:hypothetical protein
LADRVGERNHSVLGEETALSFRMAGYVQDFLQMR